jgi:HEPN domain-containing protein
LIELDTELLRTAKSDLYSTNLLLENNFFVYSMFYLSQSFEKAIKSLLVTLEKKNTTISESDIEQNLSQIATREVSS